MDARAPAPSVLVADAEYYICRVLEAKLTKDNRFRVVSATTGPDALQAGMDQDFDVLMWDMRIRDTVGYLPRLRALCPHAVLLLMSTDDRPAPNPEVQHLDVTNILTKPFGLDTLIDQIEMGLSGPAPAPTTASLDLSRVGQRLTLTDGRGRCVTRVLEKNLDSFVVVGPPRVQSTLDFVAGSRVKIEVAASDAVYAFESRLLRSFALPVTRWEMSLPRTIRRSQRRRYPRLPLRLHVQLAEAFADAKELGDVDARSQIPIAVGTTEDLSVGGCTLISSSPMAPGSDVVFDLDDGAPVRLNGRGRVLRLEPLPTADGAGSPCRYQIAVQFTNIDRGARRRLRSLLD